MKNIIIGFATLGMFSSCTIIGPSERGVRYNLGSVSEEVMQPGTHLWIPFLAGSKTFSVNVQAVETTTSSGTKDQQEVSTTVTVNIQIDPTKVVEITKSIGSESGLIDRVLPLIQESVNATVSKYSAEEILTKRGQVKGDVEVLVKEKVTKYGVIVHDIALKDMQYSKEYSAAIERKQISEQAAKQAEYETQKLEQEAKGAIAKARGEAESNKLKQATLTPQLIQYEAIQKWNGVLPTFNGSGVVPFVNIKPTN